MRVGKKSVLVIFFGLLLIVSLVQYRADVRSATMQGFEIGLVQRERSIRLVSAIASTLISTKRHDMIEGHLQDAMRVGWIDFYVVTFRGEVTTYGSIRPLSDEAYATLVSNHPPNAFWEFHSSNEPEKSIRGPASAGVQGEEEFRFFEADLGKDRRLKIGFNSNREAYFAEAEAARADENRRSLVLMLVVTFLIFLFSARDILKVAKVVRTKGIRGLKELRVLSKEAEALKHGIEGFGQEVGRLETQNKKLLGQVLPSLRTELESGKQPPYDFQCTMVRTDINNFTQIFHAYPTDRFLATINQFFTEASHIISRYDGLIHEFVGDEIIYYFKDENHANSFTAALACAREIERIAEAIHLRTSSEEGYSFRVKSSLSYGKIRFGPLLNGFSLAGAPLIETTRILSAVSEKNENTIHFDSSNVVRIHEAIGFAEAFRATLKGMEGERILVRYIGHASVSEVLRDTQISDFHRSQILLDYRSDADLKKLLMFVGSASESVPANEVLRLFNQLHITKCDASLTMMLVDVMRSLMDRGHRDQRFSDMRALATLSGALPRLIPIENFGASVDALILELVEHKDLRVVANTIETLQRAREMGRVSKILDLHLLDSKNVRVAANALVYLGTSEISQDVVRRLTKFLESQDANRVAAGFYAWGEIALYYRETDPVYYHTQSEFRSLLSRFESTVVFYPSSVRQAAEAARKAGDAELALRLEQRASA